MRKKTKIVQLAGAGHVEHSPLKSVSISKRTRLNKTKHTSEIVGQTKKNVSVNQRSAIDHVDVPPNMDLMDRLDTDTVDKKLVTQIPGPKGKKTGRARRHRPQSQTERTAPDDDRGTSSIPGSSQANEEGASTKRGVKRLEIQCERLEDMHGLKTIAETKAEKLRRGTFTVSSFGDIKYGSSDPSDSDQSNKHSSPEPERILSNRERRGTFTVGSAHVCISPLQDPSRYAQGRVQESRASPVRGRTSRRGTYAVKKEDGGKELQEVNQNSMDTDRKTARTNKIRRGTFAISTVSEEHEDVDEDDEFLQSDQFHMKQEKSDKARRGTFTVKTLKEEGEQKLPPVETKKEKSNRLRRGTFAIKPVVEEDEEEDEDEPQDTSAVEKAKRNKLRRGTYAINSVNGEEQEENDETQESPEFEKPKKSSKLRKGRNVHTAMKEEVDDPETSECTTKPNRPKRGVRKAESESKLTNDPDTSKRKPAVQEVEASGSGQKRRKKAVSAQGQVTDLEQRDLMLKKNGTKGNKFMGAHVSIIGGLGNAVLEAVSLGARAFGMFLKSQRQWNSKPLDKRDAEIFKLTLEGYGFSPSMVIPHGSYLMNCGAPKLETLAKSRAMLIDELQRCEVLGLNKFNFHPVLENMSCQGNTIGGKFTELAAIIDLVKDKSRVGICLDTCHAFAAGYDIRTEAGYEHMMTDLEDIIGLQFLKAMHINDSKGGLGCKLDKHEHIGSGQIGLKAFERIMNDPRLDNIPMILETPEGDHSEEIKSLNSMIK